jgi:ribosome-binding factor A
MTEIKDPRLSQGMVTVTGVEATNDLQQANVWVSVYGTEEAGTEAMEGLEWSRGYIKRLLAERVAMKHLPDLHFKLDRSGAYADKINRLLKQVEKDTEPDSDKNEEA